MLDDLDDDDGYYDDLDEESDYLDPRSSPDEFDHLYRSGPMCESCSATKCEYPDVTISPGVHPILVCEKCGDDVCPTCVVQWESYDDVDDAWDVRSFCRACAAGHVAVLED